MKTIRKLITAALAILLPISLSAAVLAAPQTGAAGLLWLNPASSNAPIGDDTALVIQLDGVTNVYAAEMNLAFDPAILAVVDADAGKDGVQIATGSCPSPDFVVANSADNTAGTIAYALTQLNPTPPCDGGTVATITFTCLAEGSSAVSFTHSLLSDPDGFIIAATTQDATLNCYEPNTPPNTPTNPSPADSALGVDVGSTLSWTGGDPDAGDTVTYDVMLDESNPPTTLVCNDRTTATCDPGELDPNTHYFWKVITTDSHAATAQGPVWQFETTQEVYQPLVFSNAR